MSRNRGETTCECGLPLDDRSRQVGELISSIEYNGISEMKKVYEDNGAYGWSGLHDGKPRETRFRRIECPLCGATMAGWYAFETDRWPGDVRPPGWYLHDSSFWLAFNDEPYPEDAPKVAVEELDGLKMRIAYLQTRDGILTDPVLLAYQRSRVRT